MATLYERRDDRQNERDVPATLEHCEQEARSARRSRKRHRPLLLRGTIGRAPGEAGQSQFPGRFAIPII